MEYAELINIELANEFREGIKNIPNTVPDNTLSVVLADKGF